MVRYLNGRILVCSGLDLLYVFVLIASNLLQDSFFYNCLDEILIQLPAVAIFILDLFKADALDKLKTIVICKNYHKKTVILNDFKC